MQPIFDPHNPFQMLISIPILNILIAIYKGLTSLHVPGALGFSVILLTALIRLILHPLTIAQLKSTRKLAKLKPEMDQLQKLHKDDKDRLRQEQLRLYKEAGVNPAAGCLPLLLQMPVLIALYNLFFTLLGNKTALDQVVAGINSVIYFPFLRIDSLDLSFFGLHLAHKPSEWQTVGWWLLAIPVVTGLLQYWQTKLMAPAAEKKPADAKAMAGKEDDMQAMMQKQMGIMMPLMIGFFAYSFPVGLSLYWNTFTVFGIIQQHKVNKEDKK